MAEQEYLGLLVIGDPHLEGRQPGFRKDNYPEVILGKLEWSLNYARERHLLPLILGDLFDKPRDNPNWIIHRLVGMMTDEILGIYGNHDVHYQPELTEHDSLSLLVRANCLRLVSLESPWIGMINGRPVIIGGSSYRQNIPKTFDAASLLKDSGISVADGVEPFVLWLTHHDLVIPGYDEGRIKPANIDGIDMVINGHIHRRLQTVSASRTQWLTPGNIARRSRNDAVREHIPSVLRVDIDCRTVTPEYIVIPHAPFDEVFHEAVVEATESTGMSAFVAGLSELQARRTSGGAGLKEFLKQNLNQFEPRIADEVWKLAEEVTRSTGE